FFVCSISLEFIPPAIPDVLTGLGWRVSPVFFPAHSDKVVPMRNATLTIQSKIPLLASLCLIVVVILLVGLSLYQSNVTSAQIKASSSQMLADAAQENLQAQGRVSAGRGKNTR
ncbi:hypothetical protein JWR97_22715, partial [Pseudomonas cedrina subsp. fulgida]|nr:hypothetical protein [Pseudomonas cedrina subsp. fulgida]